MNFGGENRGEVSIGGSHEFNEYLDGRFIGSILFNKFDNKPRINIGLLDLHTSDQNIGVRLGRVEHVQGYLTSQYNWPASRDFWMQPQGIYRESMRYLYRSGDGVQIYAKRDIGENVKVEIDTTWAKAVWYPKDDLNNYFVDDAYNRIMYTVNNPQLSGISVQFEYVPSGTSFRFDHNKIVGNLSDYFLQNTPLNIAASRYSTESYFYGVRQQITDSVDVLLDYNWYIARNNGVIVPGPRAQAYGVTIRWTINENWKVSAAYGAYYADPRSKRTPNNPYTPQPEMYQEDATVSVRYRKCSWTLMLEAHRLRGIASMPAYYAITKHDPHTLTIVTISKEF